VPPADRTAQVLRLSDGRRLGYAEYGDPAGAPLLFFHGTPGSRRVARWADPVARRRGIRLIGAARHPARARRAVKEQQRRAVAIAILGVTELPPVGQPQHLRRAASRLHRRLPRRPRHPAFRLVRERSGHAPVHIMVPVAGRALGRSAGRDTLHYVKERCATSKNTKRGGQCTILPGGAPRLTMI